jgi:hypothetical protein
MAIPNLLIIAGTGNKSGKTTLACRIIGQFAKLNVAAVKITPHFHETTPGLILIEENEGYAIYRETNPGISKDTSRMLRAGAADVFFAKTTDSTVSAAFKTIMRMIPEGVPVVCESPVLRRFTEPGLFVIMASKESNNYKDIRFLSDLPHVEFDLEFLERNQELPLVFNNGRWDTKSKAE